MILNYEPFITRVIHRYEGGYGWNRKDPGGPTNFGITCYDLAEHRGQKMSSMETWAPLVKAMPLSEAEAIYRVKYAGKIRFDDLPPGIDCAMLDYGINSGTARPVLVARRIFNVAGNGMDQVLLDALKKCDAARFISDINNERLRFMRAIKGGASWAEFGHGWQARVTDLDGYCHHLQEGAPYTVPAPDLTKIVTPKATNVASTAPKTTAATAIATGGGAMAAGQSWVFASCSAAAVLLGGIGYEIWQEHRANVKNNLVHV